MRTRLLLATLLLLGCAYATRVARAQADAATAPAVELIDLINDIDKLRVLNPLKLTERQLDALIKATRDAQAAYNARLREATIPAIQALAEEIRATHKAALAGREIPKAFDEKVKKLQTELVRRRETEDEKAVEALAKAFREALSASQVRTAVSLAKTLGEAKGTDDELVRFYVTRTLILYPRAVKLLEDIKKAQGAAAPASASG